MITDLTDAKRLRERLRTEHDTLREWRRVRDRRMDDVLQTLRATLPARVQSLFVPVQSQEPDDEIQTRKHLLASNEAQIEVLSRTTDAKVRKLAQELEQADEALHELLFPIAVQLDECDGFLADGLTVLAVDYLGPGPEIGKYADRAALELACDGPEPEAGTPEAAYVAAWRETGGDHEKAYDRVTQEALVQDGLRYRVRVVDADVWDAFEDPDGVSVGMEDGMIDLHPALDALGQYGAVLSGDQIVLTGTEDAAVGRGLAPLDAHGTITFSADGPRRVRYTQIRTREEIVVIADLPDSAEGDGIFIRTPQPFDRHTGYVLIEGDTKLRAGAKRRQPVTLGLLETHQRGNMLKSLAFSMGIEEATRDVYQPDTLAGAVPLDGTQEVKSQQIVDGQVTPQVPPLKRVDTTGIDLPKLLGLVDQETARYRIHEFFAGSGSSGETGIHLARLQTAYALRLQPYQSKRALAHKTVLLLCHGAVAKSGETIYVPYLPSGPRELEAGVRVAAPRQITPEMVAAPVDVRVTIGAESPETKYAAIQMSTSQMAAGTWSMTQHMQNAGVKDPYAMQAQILEDNIVNDAVGRPGQPGWMVGFVRQAAQQQLLAYIQSLLPRAAPVAPEAGPGGPPPEEPPSPNSLGPAYVPPPTQTMPGGTPVAGGVPGTPQ